MRTHRCKVDIMVLNTHLLLINCLGMDYNRLDHFIKHNERLLYPLL